MDGNALLPHPTSKNTYIFVSEEEKKFGLKSGGHALLVNAHDPKKCVNEFCVIHNPSEHHMRQWPLNWRGDRGLMERLCPHGVGHPDPDSLAFHLRVGNDWQVNHGCDGCCVKEE